MQKNFSEIKRIGRLLMRSREKQGLTLQQCSALSGLDKSLLVSLEDGNQFAFKQDLVQMQLLTSRYAKALGVELTAVAPQMLVSPALINTSQINVPSYLA